MSGMLLGLFNRISGRGKGAPSLLGEEMAVKGGKGGRGPAMVCGRCGQEKGLVHGKPCPNCMAMGPRYKKGELSPRHLAILAGHRANRV